MEFWLHANVISAPLLEAIEILSKRIKELGSTVGSLKKIVAAQQSAIESQNRELVNVERQVQAHRGAKSQP
jgi:predicted  nucleic acid-binding Zn-ribbon protein